MKTAYVARALATSSKSPDAKERDTVDTSVGRALSYLDDRISEWQDPYLVGNYAIAAIGVKRQEQLRMLANCWRGWPTMKDPRPTGTWKPTPHLSTDGVPLDGWRPRLLPLKLSPNWNRSATSALAESNRGLQYLLTQKDRYACWYSMQATQNVSRP